MKKFASSFLRVYNEVKVLLWPLLGILAALLYWRLMVDRPTVYLKINSLHTS